jgi:Protein of unknown function (DUF3606)
MSDDKHNVGKADRDRVSATEAWEVDYLVRKFGLSKEIVVKEIQAHGPMRKAVEAALERHLGGDDKTNTGKADRDRVAAGEDYEVAYLAKKFNISHDEAIAAIKQHGPMRDAIVAALHDKHSKA